MSESYHAKRLPKDLERIKNSKEICKENKQHILTFIDFMKANGLRPATLRVIAWALYTIAKMLGKPFTKAKKEDIINVIGRIEQNYNSEKTKLSLKCELKRFFKWLRNSKDYPEEVDWIKTRHNLDNRILPEEILTKQEIEKMAKVTNNLRNKALVLVLYESGCRIGELLSLKIKNIIFDEYGCVLLVSGKTGQRRVRIIEYAKDLSNWLDVHPLRNNPEAFVWIALDGKGFRPISYVMVEEILRKLAKKVGITKKVNPHALRHARATHLAKYLPEAIMKEHFGWKKDSRMASVYYHLSGKDVDEALLKVQEQEVRKCYRCEEINPSSYTFCKRCGSPLDVKLLLEIDKVSREFDNFVKDFLLVLVEQDKKIKKIFNQMVKERKLEYLFKREEA